MIQTNPVLDQTSLRSSETSSESKQALNAHGSILIVDDVADNRNILARRFLRRGYEVAEADGGQAALDLLARASFDVVLLDVMMPGMDGIETLTRIRADRSTAELPVIMVTAKSQSEDVVQALELGANDYVTKPVDFPVALARASAQISRKRAEDEMHRANSALTKLAAELEEIVSERTAGLLKANELLKAEIDQRRRSEEQIRYLAHHDALTGLPNRRLFQEQLDAIVEQASLTRHTAAVIFLDLDGFKSINDTLGHSIGDSLLRTIGDRLLNLVAESGQVARLGGDEFALVHISNGQPDAAATLASTAIREISRPLEIGGHQVNIGASAGIALSIDGQVEGERLVKQADMAMYRAKAGRRGTYCFFEPEMDILAQQRRKLEVGLRNAVANGEMEVFYQPILDTFTNKVLAFEALLRWENRELGSVPPAVFIPVAEETGLIVGIGEWVLRQATAEALKWPEDIQVAVNISTVQFSSGHLVNTVVSALAHSGLAPHRLELEVTESVMLEGSESNLALLNQLRAIGVKLAMDDFGTGYSSLSYLRTFRFDKIKIDQSFVRAMSERQDSRAIVRAVAAMGKSFNMHTTAEGVETSEQLSYLRAEGCTQVQGYLYSEPMKASGVSEFLSAMAIRAL